MFLKLEERVVRKITWKSNRKFSKIIGKDLTKERKKGRVSERERVSEFRAPHSIRSLIELHYGQGTYSKFQFLEVWDLFYG